MRIILSFFTLLALHGGVYGQSAPQEMQPVKESLLIAEKTHNFGTIQQGRPVKHFFKLINNGPDTLKIDDVHASCGCTTPVWKKEPVSPGDSTSIEVGYNAAEAGPFEKSINIFYDGGKVKTMVIKGKVYEAPATSAPLNASIRLLKQ